MPRKNIFTAEKLTLDYEGESFILKKEGNGFGSKYDLRAAYNLLKTIEKERLRTEHAMEYNLKNFYVTPKARAKLEAKVLD